MPVSASPLRSVSFSTASPAIAPPQPTAALLNGEISISTRAHTAWGAGVTAQMYLPLPQPQVWQQLTRYDHWHRYFEAITTSQVLSHQVAPRRQTRLRQVASKNFLLFHAEVEVYLIATEFELPQQQTIQFQQESGHFHDFAAELTLQPYGSNTLLTYSVQATPTLPIPAMLIQQAMHLDLPNNLRQMRAQLRAA